MEQSEIENKLKELEERLWRLENKRSDIDILKTEERNSLARKIAEKINGISTKDLILIALYLKPKQTTSEIKQMINGWGWSPDTFFEKNFGTNLVNTGLIQKMEMENNKKVPYSLTEKGKIEVEDVIKKYQLM